MGRRALAATAGAGASGGFFVAAAAIQLPDTRCPQGLYGRCAVEDMGLQACR